ncbi:MAG TPA: glycosyltransferase family 2 protein [Acidocella sp.]|nr:glycosyltransferase family 2 protein [Acidocella sp.]
MSRPFRAVIGMMQRDEDTRLEAWILYHANLFGFDALYIFDNGSVSPATLAVLRKYQARGVHVDGRHSGTAGFHQKGILISQLFQQLEGDPGIRFFIPLDCDEFLVLHDGESNLTATPAAIFGALESLLGNPHLLVTPSAYSNILGRPGHFFPPYQHHKLFFTEGCVRSMSEGFHRAQSRKLNEERETQFALLHFHHRPFADMVNHSRRKLAHFVDVTNPEALAQYQGAGNHVVRYLTMPPEDYGAMFPQESGIHLPWFIPLCKSLNVGEAFFESI